MTQITYTQTNNLSALTPKYLDNGAGDKVLQPANQKGVVTTVPTTATTADIAAIGTAVNTIIANLKSAGIQS